MERFVETRKVESFDCGNSDLNDFLCTEEVSEYEAEGLGRTYLVYYQGDLVGYFTVTNDSLRVEYLKTVKSFSKFAEKSLEALPALKIGRLAVAREHQRKGFGRLIIKYIAGMAVQLGASTGIRLLVLQAKPESIDFYEKKCGFELTRETKRERGRRNRTMFLDLYAIADVAHRR
ncbi:MAG TPA: GNAT family N-acetyltransferase [Thermoleophilia bacterium]|nr:GNAT family N-acetyltransferase [Thermoleophilia bacterium]